MACNSAYGPVHAPGMGCSVASTSLCPSKDGCIPGVCPDFQIKRHDTRPPFQVSITDCDGPMDLTDLVIEANMWAKAKLKSAISDTETYFKLADNIGFEQIMVGDIIIMDRVRRPEHMLVTGFDENNSYVQVRRGYNASTASPWNRGTLMRIMKFMNAPAVSQMILQDIDQIDGNNQKNVLTSSFLVYEWNPADVCLPGCYYLELKVLKMTAVVAPLSDVEPMSSFTPSLTPVDHSCIAGTGVEWSRRYPINGDGYLIQIIDSPTAEL